MPKMLNDILKELDDFYWEKGKYENRKLGLLQYKEFFCTAIKEAFEAVALEDEDHDRNCGYWLNRLDEDCTCGTTDFNEALFRVKSAQAKFLEG